MTKSKKRKDIKHIYTTGKCKTSLGKLLQLAILREKIKKLNDKSL